MKRALIQSIALVVLLVPVLGQADIYQCRNQASGETLFRNRPCLDDELTLMVIEDKQAAQKTQVQKSAGTGVDLKNADKLIQGLNSQMQSGGASSLMEQMGQMPGALPNAEAIKSQVTQRMMSNPALLQKVMRLAEDPKLGPFLTDPKTIEAVQSGNVMQLLNDPRFKLLMDNATIRELAGQ